MSSDALVITGHPGDAETQMGRDARQAGVEVGLVFQGIRRTLGAAPDQKNAAITAEVRAVVETFSSTSLIGLRDRALLWA